MDLLRLISAVTGLIVIVTTFYWAARILMVKGTDPPAFARMIFRACRNTLHVAGELMPNPDKRRELWSLYIPVSLLGILACSLVLATLGYMLLLYGVTQNSMRTAYQNSVSSMSTLGIAGEPKTVLESTIGGIEAFTGPVFVALLIAYTVSIYASYSEHREQVEAMDSLLVGNRDGAELFLTALHGEGLDWLTPLWQKWVAEFQELDRTARSVDGYLLLFAPNMSHHWSADAPMVLDAAAIRNSLVAGVPDADAASCLAEGTIALEHLAQHYNHRVFIFRSRAARPSVDRPAFDECARALDAAGVPTVPDRDRAWLAFQTIRNRYAASVQRLERILPYDDTAHSSNSIQGRAPETGTGQP